MQNRSNNVARLSCVCVGLLSLTCFPSNLALARSASGLVDSQSNTAAAAGSSTISDSNAISQGSAISHGTAISELKTSATPATVADPADASSFTNGSPSGTGSATTSLSPSGSITPTNTSTRFHLKGTSHAPKKGAVVTNLVERPKRELFAPLKIEELAAPTRELAEALEIMPLLREVNDPNGKLSAERKSEIRQQILETVLESYFDVASIQGEAEKEKGNLEALRQVLIDKRDHGIETNNAINFIASGTLNTVGSVLGFPKNALPFPGNFNQMLSGVISTGMSMYSLKQASGGKTRGAGNPTVAAELFGRPVDRRTAYPESVWRFLHSRSLDHPEWTRVEQLESYWISRQWLEPHGSKKEQAKLDLVCGVESARTALTIDDLTDQINIISDIAAVSSLMAHHLRDLLRMIDSDVLK
ncbi:hypothetical protein BH11CYA1_BH11CYA1_25760 [soil metagenome]